MIIRLRNYLLNLIDRQRVAIALGKGAAKLATREVNLALPATWEFSGFSQNGEDGIIDVLRKQLLNSNRYFIEIGAADGIENNSTWLLMVEKYSGLMVEGDRTLMERAERVVAGYSIGTECLTMFVTKENIHQIRQKAAHADPDLFSLDIDGNDYYVAQAILEVGFRPKIFVVEYNSVYGPTRSLTIKYQDDFSFSKAHESQLYYGVSISAWRKFFRGWGYEFVTVDQNGVNAFFVDPAYFKKDFLSSIEPLEFAGNRYQNQKFRMPDEQQFSKISNMAFVEI